jgi:hypothetical protein
MCRVGCTLRGAASVGAGGGGGGFKFTPAPVFKLERHNGDPSLSFELMTLFSFGGMGGLEICQVLSFLLGH